MATNIVISPKNINYFKACKFFKQNLGLVISVEKNGQRSVNDKDKFAFFYSNQYSTQIFAQGNVGSVKFYTDYGIKDDSIAVYFSENFDEHIFQLDRELYKEKGVDFYIGHILKTVEEEHENRKAKDELKKLEPVPIGDANKVLMNPGSVTYADLKAYMEMKSKNRYKDNSTQK